MVKSGKRTAETWPPIARPLASFQDLATSPIRNYVPRALLSLLTIAPCVKQKQFGCGQGTFPFTDPMQSCSIVSSEGTHGVRTERAACSEPEEMVDW